MLSLAKLLREVVQIKFKSINKICSPEQPYQAKVSLVKCLPQRPKSRKTAQLIS